MALQVPRRNNLEWLRLLFALQVVFDHGGQHLTDKVPRWIHYFPGVPAFFFVSGFLIYASHQHAPGVTYFHNRFLRLFPGLVVVTLGGMAVALTAHGVGDLAAHPGTYAAWFVAQTTLGQAYNPSLFRDIGVGVMNGSLWTITTEILFYLCVPIIVWLEHRLRHAVWILAALSFALYAWGPELLSAPVVRGKSLFDVLALTPAVWGWMFAAGILTVQRFDRIQPYLRYLPVALLPMVAMATWGDGVLFASQQNRLGLLYFVCYAALVLWLAFATPPVRLRHDLSYGIYVWHSPLLNLLLVLQVKSLPLLLALTVSISALSWFLVEKPALRRKRSSMAPV